MSESHGSSSASVRRREATAILWESVTVAIMGGILALAANQVSPRGLELARDYFPGAMRPLARPGSGSNTVATAGTTHTGAFPVPNPLAERIRAQGLQLISSNEVHLLYTDPRQAQEQVVFVDARDKEHYEAGHIPSAYQLDHYRVQDYLPHVLPPCLNAQQIVIYCNGGDCEDSEFAAIMLRDAGIPSARLFVYGAGFTEWSAHGWPVETGARKSGILRHAPR